MMPSFASISFGCRVNKAEEVKVGEELIRHGFEYSEEAPSLFLINSCAVTQKAEREVRQHIFQIKRKFPKTKIIIYGCAADYWLKNGINIKEADLLVGNKDKDTLASILVSEFSSNRLKEKRYNRTVSLYASKDALLSSGRYSVKIQDGCSRFCTYCIVPYLRGEPVSRKISDIITEISSYKEPVYEVILSAINTEYFGKEHKETLIQLIDAIIGKTNIQRISFGSIHPNSLTQEFLYWYQNNASNPRFVHFFHIPVQSGSDSVLARMNRHYKTEEVLKNLQKIKACNKNACIGTDILVGFLGETDKEFRETYEFLKESPIDRFHVFRYSMRRGTPARFMKKHFKEILDTVKMERSDKLRKLGKRKYHEFFVSQVGRTAQALIFPKRSKKIAQGVLDNQVAVEILNSKKVYSGIYRLVIEGIKDEIPIGRVCV